MAEIRGVAGEDETQLIALGFDTYQSAYNVGVSAGLEEILEEAKEQAVSLSTNDDVKVRFVLGGEPMLMSPRGAKGGVRYWFDSDDGVFTFMLRSVKMKYCLSVRYNAVGLWTFGIKAMRERLDAFVHHVFMCPRNESFERVTLAHFAFDSYCPDFAAMDLPTFLESLVCHQEVKKRLDDSLPISGYVRGTALETITIGPKNGLQIQVYDKGKEITEVSGKSWMREIWMVGGWKPDELDVPRNIRRIEVRFGKDYLRDRDIKTSEELFERLQMLLCEALTTRRLTVPDHSDTNRSRWPTHYLWQSLIDACGDLRKWCGIGRQVTMQGDALSDVLKKNLAGTLRSLVVLHCGDYDEELARRFWGEIRFILESDKLHVEKTEDCAVRYSNVFATQLN